MKLPKWLSRFAAGSDSGDLVLIEAVSQHVAKWVGDVTVLHEAKSEIVHVDVYWIPPAEERPFHTLVTSGMAQLAMNPPNGAEACTHAELVMFLPADWPMDRVTTDDAAYWPIKILHLLARYPHQHVAWLWVGHSLPLGDMSFPGSGFDSAMLYYPLLLDVKQGHLEMEDGRNVLFLAVVFLYPEELQFKLERDDETLFDLAEEKGLVDELMVLTLGRPSLVD